MYVTNNYIFRNSLPICLPYLVLGATFGALFSLKGGSSLEAFLISLLCFAGAAQFLSLEFYTADLNPLILLCAVFVLNLRHLFYTFTLSRQWNFPGNLYLVSALTDENFAISSTYNSFTLSSGDWVKIFGLNHVYWVLGCTIGTILPLSLTKYIAGADFLLIAFFVTVFASSLRK